MAVLKTAKARNKGITKGSNSYAKNLNLKVMHRIFQVLAEQSPIKITNLAGMARMNYGNCVKYVNLLKLLGWVDVIYNNNSHHVVITESGTGIIKRFESLALSSFGVILCHTFVIQWFSH